MKPKCGIEGCGRTHYAKGYCQAHYERNRVYGNPGVTVVGPPAVPKQRGRCSMPRCSNPHYALSLCHPHYNDLRDGEVVADASIRCTVPGCQLRHVAKGFCRGHYGAWRARAARAKIIAQLKESA